MYIYDLESSSFDLVSRAEMISASTITSVWWSAPHCMLAGCHLAPGPFLSVTISVSCHSFRSVLSPDPSMRPNIHCFWLLYAESALQTLCSLSFCCNQKKTKLKNYSGVWTYAVLLPKLPCYVTLVSFWSQLYIVYEIQRWHPHAQLCGSCVEIKAACEFVRRVWMLHLRCIQLLVFVVVFFFL